jgi:starvation-inducible DNA-binding protein
MHEPVIFIQKLSDMQPKIGITPKNLDEIAKRLCVVLADEFVLYVKTLNAHWNVEGKDFYNKHIFFETQYNAMSEIIDETAERIRSLGHYAPATLSEFLQLTHLTEQSRQSNDSTGFIELLLADHDAIIVTLRGYVNEFADELKDAGTSDYITGLIEKHEKMAWMLRSHLR